MFDISEVLLNGVNAGLPDGATAVIAILGAISVTLIPAIIKMIKAINNLRRCNGDKTCCISGRKLKPKDEKDKRSS